MTRKLPEVTVFAGPMGAGKTTELYAMMGRLAHMRIPYAAFKPGADVRDQSIVPKSFGGNAETNGKNCTVVTTLDDIPVETLVGQGIKTIILDEWFMFGFDAARRPIPDLYMRTMARWALQGVERVYAAGLDQAANGHQFGLVLDARRFGAEVVTFTALCEYPVNGPDGPHCSSVARNSQIYDARDERAYTMDSLPSLLPEGARPNDRYRAVCPEHLLLPADETKPFDPAIL